AIFDVFQRLPASKMATIGCQWQCMHSLFISPYIQLRLPLPVCSRVFGNLRGCAKGCHRWQCMVAMYVDHCGSLQAHPPSLPNPIFSLLMQSFCLARYKVRSAMPAFCAAFFTSRWFI